MIKGIFTCMVDDNVITLVEGESYMVEYSSGFRGCSDIDLFKFLRSNPISKELMFEDEFYDVITLEYDEILDIWEE